MADDDAESSDAQGGLSAQVAQAEKPSDTSPAAVGASHHTSEEKSTETQSTSLGVSNNSTSSSTLVSTEEDKVKPQMISQTIVAESASSSVPECSTISRDETKDTAPYGTRSRNRTGSARINYAEDREVDMDFEWSSKKAQNSSKAGALLPAGESGPAQVTDRKTLSGTNGTPGNKSAVQPAPGSKDYIPGTSTFSVNADSSSAVQPYSRKRKTPGTQSGSTPHSSQTSSRRGVHGASMPSSIRDVNTFSFDTCQAFLKHGKLKADDGTTFNVNDYVYLVCEPPGEPYYIARIMEFQHTNNDSHMPIDSLRVNWMYRPRDIPRKANDTRLVFATMHSDTVPLTSLRGKCKITHRNDIEDLDGYRKHKDSFYFSQMWDRYIHRYYDVIPTSQVINVPEKVKQVLDARWKFVIVEIGRGKELTSAIKTCRRCSGYCASGDSVDCAMCKNTYHMNCVRPPLLKKPARGFAWSCGPCSRKQEKRLETRNTPRVGEKAKEGDEEEIVEEEEEDNGPASDPMSGSSSRDSESPESGPRPATAEQMAQAKLWPYRYLGVHCRVEDALDYDDRIYPRASSRLGPRHQANVIVWHGRALELIKPADIKRRYVKGSSHKKEAKFSRDTIAALEADKQDREKRPKWVVDEPHGYIRRGEDRPKKDAACTAKLRFRLPSVGESSVRGGGPRGMDDAAQMPAEREKLVDEYMQRAKTLAKEIGVQPYSTNFLDKALEILCDNGYNAEAALSQLRHLDRKKDLKEPEFNKEELRRFEEGIAKHGTNLYEVSRHVGKGQSHANIVRFYYMWKKTERGRQVWGNYEGRRTKKQAKPLDSALVDDVADECDDSAFDNEKATIRKRGFECKFCSTRKSPQWRRAPSTAPGTTVATDSGSKTSKDKGMHLLVALCQRCAGLWRKYAIQWENIDEVAKKVAQAGGRAWKKKMDEELLIELANANDANSVGIGTGTAPGAASFGVEGPSVSTPEQDSSRKKQKLGIDKEPSQPQAEPAKKKVIEKPPEPPLIPEQPRIKILPCAVCAQMDSVGNPLFSCRHCRMTVHRNCYGIAEARTPNKWTCDMCSNDQTSQLSTSYECVLCPVHYNEHELMEPPRISHKKKSDREREKERLEREMVLEATEHFRRKQEELGRPFEPREPLKRTAGNNWVHVMCAVWTAEIKFGDAIALEPSEGVGSIPLSRYQQLCKICKTSNGACVTCHQCPATFHVACAQQHGYNLGFDVTPVKSSRRDVISTVTLGNELGSVAPVAYCKEHSVKSIVHAIHEPIESSNLNALQLFVRNYKQADLSLTGTVRKAAIISSSTRALNQVTTHGPGRRGSTSNGPFSGTVFSARSTRVSPVAMVIESEEVNQDGDRIVHLTDDQMVEPSTKECSSCGTSTSPKWHKLRSKPKPRAMSPSTVDSKQRSPHLETSARQSLTNGYTSADGRYDREASNFRTGSDLPEVTSMANGHLATSEVVGSQETPGAGPVEIAPRQTVRGKLIVENTVDSEPSFQCHKCFLKKPEEPSPIPKVVLPPEIPDPPPPEAMAPEVQARSPVAWTQRQHPPLPQHAPYERWSAPAPPHHAPPQHRPPHPYTNGIPRSPPRHSVHGPPSQYNAPPPAYYSNGHDPRDRHNGPPLQHHMNPGPLYGNGNSRVEHRSYPEARSYHQTSPQYPRPNSNGVPSPQPPGPPRMLHHLARPPLGPPPGPPHGPPRAAENPFADDHPEINHSRQSRPPRRDYRADPSMAGRNRARDERPRTPTEGLGPSRSGGAEWHTGGGDVGTPNGTGASASPSLRNLLH